MRDSDQNNQSASAVAVKEKCGLTGNTMHRSRNNSSSKIQLGKEAAEQGSTFKTIHKNSRRLWDKKGLLQNKTMMKQLMTLAEAMLAHMPYILGMASIHR